jgi:hypothetical protein
MLIPVTYLLQIKAGRRKTITSKQRVLQAFNELLVRYPSPSDADYLVV